jgi:hypothetical protein
MRGIDNYTVDRRRGFRFTVYEVGVWPVYFLDLLLPYILNFYLSLLISFVDYECDHFADISYGNLVNNCESILGDWFLHLNTSIIYTVVRVVTTKKPTNFILTCLTA